MERVEILCVSAGNAAGRHDKMLDFAGSSTESGMKTKQFTCRY